MHVNRFQLTGIYEQFYKAIVALGCFADIPVQDIEHFEPDGIEILDQSNDLLLVAECYYSNSDFSLTVTVRIPRDITAERLWTGRCDWMDTMGTIHTICEGDTHHGPFFYDIRDDGRDPQQEKTP